MKASQQQGIVQRLDQLVSDLQELKERELIVKSEWNDFNNEIDIIYKYFLDEIDRHIELCNNIKEHVITKHIPTLPNPIWEELINQLYFSSSYFRMFSLRLFPSPTSTSLYNYLFIKDILRTFPTDLHLIEDIKCIITHSDQIALLPITDILVGKVDSFTTIVAEYFGIHRRSRRDIEAYAFECDPREKLQNKMVLGHEIFHMIIRKKPDILQKLERAISQGIFDGYFSNIEHILSGMAEGNSDAETIIQIGDINKIDHIEELFCDFGAAWHLGPCSGLACLHELEFGGRDVSLTHPPRSARIKIILRSYGKMRHPYVDKLKRNISNFENELRTIKPTSITPITKLFIDILKNDLKIKKYSPEDKSRQVKRHIEQKIPFMYNHDIRLLFNSLPFSEELPVIKTEELNEFLFESIRRNLMILTFNDIAEEKGYEKAKLVLPKTLT